MLTKSFFEVGTFVCNSDPENLSEFDSLTEAEKEYERQRCDLANEIRKAISSNDIRLRSAAVDRTVELNLITARYDDDGELDDFDTVSVKRFGDAEDWNVIREELA